MMYVTRYTSIPVPKVHLAFTHKGCTYILMERIHGQPVGKNWLQRPLASRFMVLGSLKDIILQMRTLYTHSNLISSVNDGSLYDPRIVRCTARRMVL